MHVTLLHKSMGFEPQTIETDVAHPIGEPFQYGGYIVIAMSTPYDDEFNGRKIQQIMMGGVFRGTKRGTWNCRPNIPLSFDGKGWVLSPASTPTPFMTVRESQSTDEYVYFTLNAFVI